MKFEQSSIPAAGVKIFVKEGNKILDKAVTNKKGDFHLIFIPAKEKISKFYAIGFSGDTVFLKSVKTFPSETPDMTFYIPQKKKESESKKLD